jgi:SAM-dependent methyltransferase
MNYERKLREEREWHAHQGFRRNHLLNSRLFYSPERNAYNYVLPRKQLAGLIRETMLAAGVQKPRVLVAPVGTGSDLPYLHAITDDITGIDISEEAVGRISDEIAKYVGDMKSMTMFPSDHFDVVAIPLFFHHFASFGFDEFLAEACRVLRPGGFLFALEPNSLHPVWWITGLGKRIFGNISGAVSDEAPFNPLQLSTAMRLCGFTDIQVYGASFSHNRVPIRIAQTLNVVTSPFLRVPVVKYLAWMCLFRGRKA